MDDQERLIACVSLYEEPVLVRPEQLRFRPSVYALVVHQGHFLLVHEPRTGKHYLPGGGVNLGERLEDALQREVWEETGLTLTTERLWDCVDHFFYHDPTGEAWHGLLIFFVCHVLAADLPALVCHDAGEALEPRWCPVQSVNSADFYAVVAPIVARFLAASKFNGF